VERPPVRRRNLPHGGAGSGFLKGRQPRARNRATCREQSQRIDWLGVFRTLDKLRRAGPWSTQKSVDLLSEASLVLDGHAGVGEQLVRGIGEETLNAVANQPDKP
jgi:hypothetical protein